MVNVLDDYISGPYEVFFVSGSTDSVLDITIVDDNLLEPVERFNLIIDSLSGDATIGNLDNVTISIIDNDGKCVQLIVQSRYDDFAAITVQFVQSLYVIAEESRMAQPELIFSNPSYTDINVTIVNNEVDATGELLFICIISITNFTIVENVDYDYPGPYNVTIPAGQTRLMFTISIINDSKNEGIENFTVIISSADLHPNVSIGSINATIVSIIDNIGEERGYITLQSVNFAKLLT